MKCAFQTLQPNVFTHRTVICPHARYPPGCSWLLLAVVTCAIRQFYKARVSSRSAAFFMCEAISKAHAAHINTILQEQGPVIEPQILCYCCSCQGSTSAACNKHVSGACRQRCIYRTIVARIFVAKLRVRNRLRWNLHLCVFFDFFGFCV